jgi:hypothetical protein
VGSTAESGRETIDRRAATAAELSRFNASRILPWLMMMPCDSYQWWTLVAQGTEKQRGQPQQAVSAQVAETRKRRVRVLTDGIRKDDVATLVLRGSACSPAGPSP